LKRRQLPVLGFNVYFNSGLFIEKTVCSKCGNQVHNEVVNGAMARMFNVADVFQFIYIYSLTCEKYPVDTVVASPKIGGRVATGVASPLQLCDRVATSVASPPQLCDRVATGVASLPQLGGRVATGVVSLPQFGDQMNDSRILTAG
jgi:hypothetical protein